MEYLVSPEGFSKEIDFKLPINYKQEWSHLFKPDNAYKKVKLGARLLKNVFVNHYGLVIKNGVLVKGCAPNIGHTKYEDNNFYFKHWKKATEQWLVAKFGNSVASKRLDDHKTYLVIHSPWFSYYFWITECIPRLLMVKEHLHELTLIYPENWKNFSFVNETLDLFPELEREVIPSDVHLFVKNLVMPEVKPWTPMFIPEIVYETRVFLLDILKKKGITYGATDRIYISRENANRKKFVDEKKVVNLLKDYNFSSVCMEKLSFFEQIALMSETKILTAMTGAGMINTIFMKSNGALHDLTNIDYLTKSQYKFHFYQLCNILGVKYAVTFFEHENDPLIQHYSLQDLIMNSISMKKDIEKLIDNVK